MAAPLLIRHLRPGETRKLEEHLLRLDAHQRYLRFCTSASDDYIGRYVEGLRRCGFTAVGAFEGDQLRGVAECRLIEGSSPRSAEIALSVEAAYQRQGVGSTLFARALAVIRNRGVRRCLITTLPSNRPMRAIARRFGMTLSADGDVEGRLELEWATPLSLNEEIVGEGLAWMGELADLFDFETSGLRPDSYPVEVA
jgi:GNAT superfamily N-acetyltransferase